MRVLVVPEFYRPGDATTNGTVNDALAWIREWLARDDALHVYVLVPPRDPACDGRAYDGPACDGSACDGSACDGSACAGPVRDDPVTRLGDRERVTLVEADRPLCDVDPGEPFTENGYSSAQLDALHREIYEPGAYVDVVVDQLRGGRDVLYKWLLEHHDQWAASVRPFDVVANVHDLQTPRKHRYCSYRNRFQFRLEAASVAFADGAWFTAGVDARAFREDVDFLAPDVVEATVEDAVVAGSPIEFDAFEETYAADPEILHLAGSFWAKKNVDRLFDVAETLHDRFGVRTLLTSVDPIPARYRELDWVEAHGEADRGTYERALAIGDLAVCASDYETMARTPFEQAASGQVVVFRDAPWVAECVPDDHPLVAPVDELAEQAVAAVEDWERSVDANRRLVAHARDVRGPSACGERTYRDLRRRVDDKRARYERDPENSARNERDAAKRVHYERDPERLGRDERDGADDDSEFFHVVARAARDCGDRVELPAVEARTAAYAHDGRPVTDRDDVAFVDLLYALRALGYADTGNPGTPVFERA